MASTNATSPQSVANVLIALLRYCETDRKRQSLLRTMHVLRIRAAEREWWRLVVALLLLLYPIAPHVTGHSLLLVLA